MKFSELSKLKNKELKYILKQNKIKNYSNMNKAELLEKMEEIYKQRGGEPGGKPKKTGSSNSSRNLPTNRASSNQVSTGNRKNVSLPLTSGTSNLSIQTPHAATQGQLPSGHAAAPHATAQGQLPSGHAAAPHTTGISNAELKRTMQAFYSRRPTNKDAWKGK
jgi:hypothetical protein